MPIETMVDKEAGVIIRTVTGRLTFEDAKLALNGLVAVPDYEKGMSALWDLRKADMSKIVEADIYRIAGAVKKGIEDRGTDFKLALVTSKDYQFGMSRMYEAIAQDLPLEIKVFRDMEQAMIWVGESEDDEDS